MKYRRVVGIFLIGTQLLITRNIVCYMFMTTSSRNLTKNSNKIIVTISRNWRCNYVKSIIILYFILLRHIIHERLFLPVLSTSLYESRFLYARTYTRLRHFILDCAVDARYIKGVFKIGHRGLKLTSFYCL